MLDKVQKGFQYLKSRGIRETAAHAREKYRDSHFDYNRWVYSQKLSPAAKGYQKTLTLSGMPKIWAMVLRREEDGLRESRLPEASILRQTRKCEGLLEVLTTRVEDDDLIVFVPDGAILSEDAFFRIACAAREGARCLYSDEDLFEPVSQREHEVPHFSAPRFKPDFDPDYLRSMNYIGSLYAVRAGLLRQAEEESGSNNLASAKALSDYAAYYKMILLTSCLAEKAASSQIVHIPKILCHLRRREEKSDDERLREVLKEDLRLWNREGIVEYGPAPGTFHLYYPVRENPLVSIIIPNKDHSDLLRECIASIRDRTLYENLEVIIAENNSEEEETFRTYEELKKDEKLRVRVVTYGRDGFNFSEIINQGAAAAAGDYLVLMNNDVTVKSPDWIERLLSQVRREGVGAAGPRLLYPDGTIQSAGIVIGIMGFAGSMMVGESGDRTGYMHRAFVTQEMSAVTAACMMVKKSAFLETGGFDASLAVALNDVDFCLKLGQAGYRVIYDPSAVLVHHESRSRGYEDSPEKRKRFNNEKKIFTDRYRKMLLAGDPHYNPNLSDRKCDYSQKT